MRICFISGNMNPGKCGISDYIALLRQELIKSNCKVDYCSIQDFINGTKQQSFQAADCYSIQLAPYLFSPNGILGKNAFKLATFLRNQNTHINFHEIWVGAFPSAHWKERLGGWVQKKKIIKFIDLAKPKIITASNSASLDRLICAGINAKYLYLFGNIPFYKNPKSYCNDKITVIIFGTLYKNFPYQLLADKLHLLSISLGKSLELRILGRHRERDGLKLLYKMFNKYGFSVIQTGELPCEKISSEFQEGDLGICTTPYDIIGKSGATAAMLEHGLPVLAFDDGDTPKDKLFLLNEFNDQVFLLNNKDMLDRLIIFLKKERKPFWDGVVRTANDMLKILS